MTADLIAQVRQFNRTIVDWICSRNDQPPYTDRPLGELRVMQTIGDDGTDIARLTSETQLTTRDVRLLLVALEDARLVALDRSAPHDEIAAARLTTEGRIKLQDEERRLDDAFERLLSALNAAQRKRLVFAMRQLDRLLRAATVSVRVGDPHHPHFQLCLDAYYAELADRYGGFDPSISRQLPPEQLIPPGGLLVMAYTRDLPVGCGAMTFGDDRIGAIKRIWVSRDYRGLGVGSRILDELECRARDNGIRSLRLENRHELYEATEMYRQFGYRDVDPFNDEYYADRWYEKVLASDNVGRIATDVKHPVPMRDCGTPPTQY